MDLYAELVSDHESYARLLVALTGAVNEAHATRTRAHLIAILDPLFGAFTVGLASHIERDEEQVLPQLLHKGLEVIRLMDEHRRIRESSAQFGYWYQVWRLRGGDFLHHWTHPASLWRSHLLIHMQTEKIRVLPLLRSRPEKPVAYSSPAKDLH